MAQDDWLGLESASDGDDWLGLDQALAEPEPPAARDSVTADLAASWGVGSNMLLRGVGSLYGLATGNMDNAAVRQGESGMEYWADRKSPTLVGAEEGRSSAIEAADGELAKFGTAIWETVKDPRLLASFVIEQAPMTVGPGAVGRAGAVGASALGAGAKTAGVVGTGGAIGAGAGLQAADVGERVYSDLLGLPAEMWEQNEDFQALAADIGPDEAMRELALEYARSAAQASGGLSVASQAVPGGSTIERVLGRGRGGPGGLLSRVVRGAAGEGAQEVIEEGGGQAIGNYALSQIDPNQKLTEGLGESAGLALVGGGVLGGTAGLAGAGAETGPPSDEMAANADLAAMRQRDLDAEAAAAAADVKAQGGDTLDALLAEQEVYMNGEAAGSATFRPDQFDPIPTTTGGGFAPGMQSPASIDPATGLPVEGRGDWVSAPRRRLETEQAIAQGEQELAQSLAQREQQRQRQAMEQSWKGIPQQTPVTGFEGGSDLVPGADQSPGRFGRTGQPQQTEALSANLDGTGRVLVGDGTQDEIFSRRMAEALEREDQGMARARDERGYRQIGLGMPEREVPADPEGYQGGPAAREQVEQDQVARLEKLYEETRAKMPEREKGNQTIPSVDMDVLQYIASAGGINLKEGRARGFDSGDTGKRAGGIARVFTAKGQTFDEMAERMAQDGFFEGRDYSPNELETMVRRAMGGEMIFSPRSEKAGMTAAIQADLDRIESAIAGIENNRLEDADSPPRGPRWQAESDPMRQMIYTLTEAEAVGVPQRDIDRILDTSSTPEQADASLRQEIELEKQFRGFWFGPQAAGESDAEGAEAALGGTRPQEEGRDQEATAEQVGPDPTPEGPEFSTYAEAQTWIDAKSKEHGGKGKFTASQEYADAYPQIKALQESERDADREASRRVIVAKNDDGTFGLAPESSPKSRINGFGKSNSEYGALFPASPLSFKTAQEAEKAATDGGQVVVGGRGQEASATERLAAAQARRDQAESDKDVNAMIDAGSEASAALIDGIQAEMDAGRMPVIQDGSLYHAIHPSTSRPGKLQITTYNDTGALSDTTVDDMDGVQRELNASKARVMPADEASETMDRIGRAEAEYQQRRKAFELSQETEQQRADRERTQRETQDREATASATAEQKAKADAEVGDFALSGSDRPADANANQVDLLDAPAQDSEPAADSNVRTLRAAQEKKAAEKAASKLNEITITETMLDESGNEVTVEQSAAVALRLIDKRLQVLDQLLGCVTGST